MTTKPGDRGRWRGAALFGAGTVLGAGGGILAYEIYRQTAQATREYTLGYAAGVSDLVADRVGKNPDHEGTKVSGSFAFGYAAGSRAQEPERNVRNLDNEYRRALATLGRRAELAARGAAPQLA